MAYGDLFRAPPASGGDVNDSSPPYGIIERQGSGDRATVKILEAVQGGDPRHHRHYHPAPDGTSDRSRCMPNMPFDVPRGVVHWFGYAVRLHTGWKFGSQVHDDGSTYTVLWSFSISGKGPGCGIDLDSKDGGTFKSDRQTSHNWTDNQGANTLWLGPAVSNQWVFFKVGIRFTSTVQPEGQWNRIYFRKDSPTANWVEMGRSRYQTVIQDGGIRHRIGLYQGNGVNHDRTLSYIEAMGKTEADADVSTLFGATAPPEEPPPPAARVSLGTLDDPLNDLAAFTENSGSPTVNAGVVTLPPGSEIKRPPTFDVRGHRLIVEATPAIAASPALVDLLKLRVTAVAGTNNGNRVSAFYRQTYGAAAELQLVVGSSTSDTGIVKVPAPASFTHMALGFVGDQFTVDTADSITGPWTTHASRELPAFPFATDPAKVAAGSSILGGESAITPATVTRMAGRPTGAASSTPTRRTQTRTFAEGNRIQITLGGLIGAEPKTFAALVKKTDQSDRTFGGIARDANGGQGRSLHYAAGVAKYNDGANGGRGVVAAMTLTDYDLVVGVKLVDNTSAALVYSFANKSWTEAAGLAAVAAGATSTGSLMIGATSKSASAASAVYVGDIAVFGATNKALTVADVKSMVTADGEMTLLSLWEAAGFSAANGAEVWDLTEATPTRRVGTSTIEATTGTTLTTTASVPWELAPLSTVTPPTLGNFQGPGSDPANPVFTFDLVSGDALTSLRWRRTQRVLDGPTVVGGWVTAATTARSLAVGAGLAPAEYDIEIEADNAHANPPVVYTRTWLVNPPNKLTPVVAFVDVPAEGAVLATGDVRIEFVSDVPGSTFEIRVDSSEWVPIGLQSVQELSNLPDGNHFIAVRALANGFLSTEVLRTFRVDRGAPAFVVDLATAPRPYKRDRNRVLRGGLRR